MPKLETILNKITVNSILKIIARVLLAGNLLIMVILRNVYPLPSLNEHRIAERWIQHTYKQRGQNMHQFLPSYAWSMQNSYYFVTAYQILDYVLIVLILIGIKLGPRILMYRTLLLLILHWIVFVPTYKNLFVQPGQQSMQYFRELGIIGSCLLLI